MTEAKNESYAPQFISGDKLRDLGLIADFLRRDTFQVIDVAQNGHIGGSSSSVELLTALYFGGQFKFDPDDPDNPNRDKVLLRGHEGPIRYPIFSLLGYIDREELWTYRQLGSRLQGHEDMHITPGVDITPSGSLGMLLSYGVGASIAAKENGLSSRTIVFLGDGEEQEGNVSEAARHASSIGLDNLICIIDRNTKQLSRPTAESDAGSNLQQIWKGYGWNVVTIEDGHDLQEIMTAYDRMQTITKQTVIIANTNKGHGVEGNEEHFSGYHTLSAMNDKSLLKSAIANLDKKIPSNLDAKNASKLALLHVTTPETIRQNTNDDSSTFDIRFNKSGTFNMDDGQMMYFEQLRKNIMHNTTRVPFYMLTPDLMRTDLVEELHVGDFVTRYIDTGLREQHTIAMAHGISTVDPTARLYVCYGDAFLYRAADQMNAAATGGSNMVVTGENAGLFQGQNGKTHQSIGQPGSLLEIPEITALEPADVHDLFNILSNALVKNRGFTYVRMHRGEMPALERNVADEGNTRAYNVHVPERTVRLVLAASGYMVKTAIGAAKTLEAKHGIPTQVVNVIDQKSLIETLPDILTNNAPILTVYNGSPVTLQKNVSSAIMSMPDIPRPKIIAGHGFTGGTSGSVKDLLKHYQLDDEGITRFALNSLKEYL